MSLLGRLLGGGLRFPLHLEELQEGPQNDARGYGVVVRSPQAAPGDIVFDVLRVHHLTPEENRGNHHIYVDVLDEEGRRLTDAQVRIVWAEGSRVFPLNTDPTRPGVAFPMNKWDVYEVDVMGMPSARVVGISAGHPAEGRGNPEFRHSFLIVFQRRRVPVPEVAPPPQPAPPQLEEVAPAPAPTVMPEEEAAPLEETVLFTPPPPPPEEEPAVAEARAPAVEVPEEVVAEEEAATLEETVLLTPPPSPPEEEPTVAEERPPAVGAPEEVEEVVAEEEAGVPEVEAVPSPPAVEEEVPAGEVAPPPPEAAELEEAVEVEAPLAEEVTPAPVSVEQPREVAAEVTAPVAREVTPPSPLDTYVLFVDADSPTTVANFFVAMDDLLAAGVPFGFDATDAVAHARRVIIVGEAPMRLVEEIRARAEEVVTIEGDGEGVRARLQEALSVG